MYQSTLHFFIISRARSIEDALRAVPCPGDCAFTFETCDSLETAPLDGPDSALILDCTGGTILPPDGIAECAAVFPAGSIGQPGPLEAAARCDVWYVPESGGQEMLRACFSRFARRCARASEARKIDICFQTLINSVPDLIWFKDVEGRHLIVNDSFCKAVAKTREDIQGRKHAYIWGTDENVQTICTISDGLIMDARETQMFEEVVETSHDTVMLKSYKSPLIDCDGSIFGTCGIAHDITEAQNTDREFSMIMDGLSFGVIMEDTNGTVLHKNLRFDEFFPEFYDLRGRSSAVWRESIAQKIHHVANHTEVRLKYDRHELVLLIEEKPLLDVFGRVKGKITTFADITEESNIIDRRERQANTDFLTGLSNRRAIQKHLEGLPSRETVTLVMTDLDNFKQVNDVQGHDAGDRALIITARILLESFEGDFVSRLGGDEFLIAVSGRTQEEIVRRTREFIRRIAEAAGTEPELKGVTASAGIVCAALLPSDDRDDLGRLMKAVDTQLYEAKHAGKNCCAVYGDSAG